MKNLLAVLAGVGVAYFAFGERSAAVGAKKPKQGDLYVNEVGDEYIFAYKDVHDRIWMNDMKNGGILVFMGNGKVWSGLKKVVK